ncbi:epididymal secretory protein E3-beta [Monodelphis domestica]|uniref:Epididymal secretory protein E3-beta n=1 Tax=Monodelphis domestica TaxID=13616 RepID=F7E3H1_MONDO|nr:epididymal secretory protein E3-beta [Monodelphis domestica]
MLSELKARSRDRSSWIQIWPQTQYTALILRQKVTLVDRMASVVNGTGPVLLMLLSLWVLPGYSEDLAWQEFMKQHHLSLGLDFNQLSCEGLMGAKESLKGKASHTFIYAFWSQIEDICYRDGLDRYENVQVWSKKPFKILTCEQLESGQGYRSISSYSYVELHCGLNGFPVSLEDIKVKKIISN